MTIASALLEKGGKPNNGQTIEEAINEISLGMVVKNVNNTLDKTYQEIYDSLAAGTPVFIIYYDAGTSAWGIHYVTRAFAYAEDFMIRAMTCDGGTPTKVDYSTPSVNGYPSLV